MVSKFYFSDHLQFLNFMLVVHKKKWAVLVCCWCCCCTGLKRSQIVKIFYYYYYLGKKQMSVIVTEMVSVTSRIESSHFHGLGTELRTSGSARLFQAMFFQCLWCRQLPSHMILYWAETSSCSSRICGDRLQSRFRRSQYSSVGFIKNLSFRLLRVAQGFKHAKMLKC